jgi:hypothetical protein
MDSEIFRKGNCNARKKLDRNEFPDTHRRRLNVCDRGPGIPAGDRAHLWRRGRFQRLAICSRESLIPRLLFAFALHDGFDRIQVAGQKQRAIGKACSRTKGLIAKDAALPPKVIPANQ